MWCRECAHCRSALSLTLSSFVLHPHGEPALRLLRSVSRGDGVMLCTYIGFAEVLVVLCLIHCGSTSTSIVRVFVASKRALKHQGKKTLITSHAATMLATPASSATSSLSSSSAPTVSQITIDVVVPHTSTGKMRYANNSQYKNDTIIRKEVRVYMLVSLHY